MEGTRIFWGKINQRGITRKLRKGEQSLLCTTLRLDLIHIPRKLHEDIPRKLHEDIPNGYRYKKVWKKINQRDITQKLRKGSNHSFA